MKSVIFLLVISLCPTILWAGESSPLIDCKVKARLTSQGSIGETILEELRQTKTKLSMAIYGFNNLELAEELVNLAKRGISVRIKMDDQKTMKMKHRRVIQSLRARGVPVQIVGRESKNHNKFVVIDGAKVITGSYNWTLRAEKNWENLLILNCPKLAEMYEREWEIIR